MDFAALGEGLQPCVDVLASVKDAPCPKVERTDGEDTSEHLLAHAGIGRQHILAEESWPGVRYVFGIAR